MFCKKALAARSAGVPPNKAGFTGPGARAVVIVGAGCGRLPSRCGGVRESPAGGVGESPAGGVGDNPAGGLGDNPAGSFGLARGAVACGSSTVNFVFLNSRYRRSISFLGY